MNINQAISSFEELIQDETDNPGFQMPARNIVCPECKGEGQVGPGWVFTESDRQRMGEDFYELMEELKNGVHDYPCEQCKGLRVIKEIDLEALGEELRTRWANWLREIYSMEAMEHQERMMGA